MTVFLWNLLLALLWTSVTGEITLANLFVGFVIGYLVLLVARPVLPASGYFGRLLRVILFVFRYIVELIVASVRVAFDVVTPPFYMRPGVVAVPLDAETDLEITLVANLLSLTPGTLSLDLSSDRKVLYVHAMYLNYDDIEGFRRKIKSGLERRVLELLR